MKTMYARRYRRSRPASREAAMFKKNNQQEQTFFGGPANETFFKANASIQRKCDECAADNKKVQKMSDSKEEEKKVQKTEEKKEEEKPVQKMSEPKEEEKKVQKQEEKEEDKSVQKMADKEEEKKVQKMEEKKEKKPVQKMSDQEDKKIDKKDAGASAATIAQTGAYINSLNGKGSALPPETQQFFASRMGHDFSQVRIHTGSNAEQSAKEMNAKAYAVDHHLVFNKGQYNPGSAEGKKLLAHELTHVVQQKNNHMELVSRASDKANHRSAEESHPVSFTGKATNSKKQTAYGCEGLNVQGQTDANYTDTFNTKGTAKPSDKCEDCPDDCVAAKGNIISEFKANPTVTLPSVPDGLTDCETKAVSKFINTTLKNHEQKHVAAFKKYNGVITTPYKYTGCQSGLDSYLQSVHDGINQKRMTAANAKSAALDPFNPVIPCKCD